MCPSPVERVLEYVLPTPACPHERTLWNVPALLFSDRICLRAAVSRVLGVGIVAGAGLIKLPQVYRVVTTGSVAGLSATSFAVDTFGYTYNLAAHYRQGYPVTTYGDFAVLLAQNMLLLYMCYAYTGRGGRGVAVCAAFGALLAFFTSPSCPLEVVQTLTLLNIPVVFIGRLPQIYTNYVRQSTGALSALSTIGVFLGATARIFTTLQDVDNYNILLGYVASSVLNGIIALQVIMYRNKAPPVAAAKKSK